MSLHLSKCHIVGNHMPGLIGYQQAKKSPLVGNELMGMVIELMGMVIELMGMVIELMGMVVELMGLVILLSANT